MTAFYAPAPLPVEPTSSALPPLPPAAPPLTPPLARVGMWSKAVGVVSWLFGVFSLVVGLAVVATVPVVQLVSLGYLLESQGRVARSRRFRDGFPGRRQAARLGGIVIGAGLWLLPLWAISMMAQSAYLIDPQSASYANLSLALVSATVVVAMHVAGACFRGGKLRHFAWPAPVRVARLVLRRGAYAEARDAVWAFFVSLRLPYLFWLGLRGFAAALAWLVVPIGVLAGGQEFRVLAFVGGAMLAAVLLYLPMLQARFAAEGRMAAYFGVQPVRELFCRAPLAFLLSILATLTLSLPLYLFKVILIPRDAAWLECLVFVALLWPARLLAGWSYAYAARRPAPRRGLIRWTCRLATVPVVVAYVVVVFLTQYTSWYGVRSLYQQHAFLLPVPFLGMDR